MKPLSYLVFLALLLFGASCRQSEKAQSARSTAARVLVYSKTQGYRHECIETGIAALKAFFAPHQVLLTATEDSTWFSADKLADFDAIMFFQTTGNVLTPEQEKAVEAFIQSGKGFIGVHAASDTEYDWTWYTGLVGAQFASNSEIRNAVVVKRDSANLACQHLPDRWMRRDEWYNFRALPSDVRVLLAVDEDTYPGGAHGADHPVTWCHEYAGGRAFYTAMGHTVESYQDTLFLRHLLLGTQWAIGAPDRK